MRITPSDSWSWSYQNIDNNTYLGLHIVLDDGARYFFRTNFKAQTLATFPDYGEPFCILDGQLLSDYMAGLEAIGVYDNSQVDSVSINMELALNAVACARFVAEPPRVIEHAFLPYDGPVLEHINRGMVSSLYTREGKIVDFIVLDDEYDVKNGVFRLMFVNSEFHIGRNILAVGAMIKVYRNVICPFTRPVGAGKPGANYA